MTPADPTTEIEPVVYLNGERVPASKAKLNIYDAGIVMGAALAEMTRTFNHEPFRLVDHVHRLFRSLKHAGLRTVFSPAQLTEQTLKLIRHNAAMIGAEEDLGVVHFVTPGDLRVYAGSAVPAGEMTPTVCIHSFPLPFSYWKHYFTDGAHVVTPAVRHIPPQCLDPRMKYRSRLHWFIADQQSRNVDPKAVSLLLDLDGNITETGGSNFLIVEGSAVISPMPGNILDGISLRTARELALECGMTFHQRDLQPYDVVNADEAWLTTTPYCMAPVTKINNIAVGDGRIGPWFDKVLNAWSLRVGKDIRRQVMDSSR